MIAVDWFSGIGGFALGLQHAGHEVAAACEIEPAPRQVYAEHFEEPRWKDVRHVEAKEIPQADLWTAGFPCQDLSSAGLRRGIDGKRSGLVWSLLGHVAVARPRWILLENVAGLLVRGAGFGRLLRALADLGYGFAWRVLDAQFFRVAQRRKRVFVLACRDPRAGHFRAAEVLLEPESVPRAPRPCREKGSVVASCLTTRPGGRCRSDDTYVVQSSGSNAQQFAKRSEVARTLDSNGPWGHGGGGTVVAFDAAQVTSAENRSRCAPGDPAPTLNGSGRASVAYSVHPSLGASDGLRAIETDVSPTLGTHGGHRTDRGVHVAGEAWVRRLTPLECERLQGFPDGWAASLSDTARYKALGNSVAVPVVEWIGRRLGGA